MHHDLMPLTAVESSCTPNDIVIDTYGYDASGRRITETNGESEVTRYFYDLHGNVRQRRTPLGRNTTYEYDTQGRKTREVNPISGQLTWAYSYFGKLTAHSDLGSVAHTYTYDTAGLQRTQTNTIGQNIVFGYDQAGQLTLLTDNGVNRITTITYDASGRRAREKTRISGRVHQDTAIAYDELGRIRTLSDLRYGLTYSYDAHGNRSRIADTYYDHEQTLRTQDLWYSYDGMHRVLISQGVNNFGTLGISTTQGVRLTYDLAGQRRTSQQHGSQFIQHEHGEVWDPDILDTRSIDEWNLLSRYYTDTHSYDGLGRLTATTRSGEDYHIFDGPSSPPNITITPTAYTIDTRVYDRASREISGTSQSVEAGALQNRSRTNDYNDDSQLFRQTNRKEIDVVGVPTMRNESVVNYTNDAAGVVRSYSVEVWNTTNNTVRYTSNYTTSYRLGETYQESGQNVSSTGSGAPQNGSTTRGFNANGELISFTDSRDANKNRYFANSAGGTPLTVVQGNYSTVAAQNTAFQDALARRDNSVKAQHFFFANAQHVGSFGQLQEAGVFKANFDVNYTPVSGNYPASVPAEVVVQSGDTLRSLAARVFGDANLWYILAEENGLSSPDEVLVEGTLLRVPNEVVTLGNTANSFKPFDMTQALGDTTPTQPMPPPKKGGCGIIGMIIVIVVAIVVTVITAGAAAPGAVSAIAAPGTTGFGALLSAGTAVLTGSAATTIGFGATVGAAMLGGAVGSVVSQGVGIAIGAQDRFDWGSVAVGAIGAGVTAGIGGAAALAQAGRTGAIASFGKFVKGLDNLGQIGELAARAALNSAITQGISVATGLQSSFSWREVAMSAVTAPIAEGARGLAGGYFDSKFVGEVASGLASWGVRAAMGGKVDVATIVADVFGNAIGNTLVETLSLPPEVEVVPMEPEPEPEPFNPNAPEFVLAQTGAQPVATEEPAFDEVGLIPTYVDKAEALRDFALILEEGSAATLNELRREYMHNRDESLLGAIWGEGLALGQVPILGSLLDMRGSDALLLVRSEEFRQQHAGEMRRRAALMDLMVEGLTSQLAAGESLSPVDRAYLDGNLDVLTQTQRTQVIDRWEGMSFIPHDRAVEMRTDWASFAERALRAVNPIEHIQSIAIGTPIAIWQAGRLSSTLERRLGELREIGLQAVAQRIDDPLTIPQFRRGVEEAVELGVRLQRNLIRIVEQAGVSKMRRFARLLPPSARQYIERFGQSRQGGLNNILGRLTENAVDLIFQPLVGAGIYTAITADYKYGQDNGVDRVLFTRTNRPIYLEVKGTTRNNADIRGLQARGARHFVPWALDQTAAHSTDPNVQASAERLAARARLPATPATGYAIVGLNLYSRPRYMQVEIRVWDSNVRNRIYQSLRPRRSGRI